MRLFILTAIAVLVGFHPPATARDSDPAGPDITPLIAFQGKEDRLFRIGYRLATANAPFCRETVPVSGMLLHDASSYSDPQRVRATFGLLGDIGVQSVAPGSPATSAGISQDMTLLAVDDEEVTGRWPVTKPRWKRLTEIQDLFDSKLAAGPVEITVAAPGEPPERLSLSGTPACRSRFELRDSDKSMSADGVRVLVGEDFPGFAYDEPAFAAAIAHELAHNILGHPQHFNRTGWKRSRVRVSERDADRLAPWLLYNAGYDPIAAVRFMKLWGPRHDGGIFRKRDHDGWDERVEAIEAELATIKLAREVGNSRKLDWATDFLPELRLSKMP